MINNDEADIFIVTVVKPLIVLPIRHRASFWVERIRFSM